MIDINVDFYLEKVKKCFPKFDKKNLQSSNETLARYAQIIYVRGLRDSSCSYNCKNCGEYTCGEYEKKAYKFCPSCGEKLEEQEYEIYISDKEIDNNNLNYVVEDWYEEYWLLKGNKEENGFEIHDDVGLVEIQSLEQHEEEIRKQERQKVIAELEKEKQTAVKEFADELYKGLNDLTKHGYTDDQWENICISKYDVEDKIIQLLKEKGINNG